MAWRSIDSYINKPGVMNTPRGKSYRHELINGMYNRDCESKQLFLNQNRFERS